MPNRTGEEFCSRSPIDEAPAPTAATGGRSTGTAGATAAAAGTPVVDVTVGATAATATATRQAVAPETSGPRQHRTRHRCRPHPQHP